MSNKMMIKDLGCLLSTSKTYPSGKQYKPKRIIAIWNGKEMAFIEYPAKEDIVKDSDVLYKHG